MDGSPRDGTAASAGDRSVELSARRTEMSFQRTRMSADRTLMSVIRTSLSLITFGFTIAQFLARMAESQGWRGTPARNFGTALVLLGIVMLVLGIGYHLAFMAGLRNERKAMKEEESLHAQSHFPVSMTLIVALLLLLTAVLAVMSLLFRMGPFG